MKPFRSSLSIIVILTVLAYSAGHKKKRPKLLMILADGFRWDYLTRFNTPNIEAMIQAGVQADHLDPVFPTYTIPNIYTYLTGRYPQYHGLVNNFFLDSETGKPFLSNITDAPNWLQTEPLWETLAKKHLSFSAVPDDSTTNPHDFMATAEEAVKRLIDQNYDVVWLYFDDPDSTGHAFGPYSQMVAVEAVDAALGKVFSELTARGMLEHVNIMINGDHGMAYVPTENRINVTDCLVKANASVILAITETIGNVHVPAAGIEAAYQALSKCHPNLKAYRVQDVPAELHYNDNPRIGQIVLIANVGWFAYTVDILPAFLIILGRHGYAPSVQDMQTIFIARGPSFCVNHKVPAFSILDIYELVCHLTGAKPAPNDGCRSATKGMLKKSCSRYKKCRKGRKC